MKQISLLIMAVLVITGCSKSDAETEIIPTPEPAKEYIISLGFFGEITDISESPLTRAATNDLYGIQVYSMPTNGVEYKPYAYGLFDDKTKMTVKLLEGYKYKFESTMVVDGKNKMYSTDKGYTFPFYTGENTPLNNQFTYSSNKNMSQNISRGTIGMMVNDQYIIPERPNVDRYYGITPEYVPTGNGSVSINMKRVVFGAKIVTEGLTDGKIKITLEKSPTMYVTHPATMIEDIYTFENTNNYSDPIAWTNDDYTETVPLSASWEKADGAIVPLVNQDITFKRNKLTTITIKVKDNSVNNGVDVSQENTPMGDGGNIVIDTSTGSDTGVVPNP